jgi:hypothetical protein
VQWIAASQIIRLRLTRTSAAHAARLSPRISALHRPGFFSDLVDGGSMVSWRMIGVPGASASHHDVAGQHGVKDWRPMSIAAIGADEGGY